MSIASLGPYQVDDIFQYGVQFVGLKDIFSLAKVCRQYNRWSNAAALWRQISEREGIPCVASLDGTPRAKPKEDFRVLYPLTISSRIIGQFYGKVVGSVPPISQFWFDKLNKPDPYAPKELGRDNYVVVVNPSYIKRSVDQKTPLDLDNTGSLVEVAADAVMERNLTIPFSLKNLRTLSSYPINGKENLPVFAKNSWDEAFRQGTSFPERVGVYFMRRFVVEQSRGLPFAAQETIVTTPNEGFTVTPLRIRALFDSISILRSGTCPDGRGKRRWTIARTSDIIRLNNREYHLEIGGFAPGSGVGVGRDDIDDDDIGVVPGGPAEVPGPLALGHLALDEGH